MATFPKRCYKDLFFSFWVWRLRQDLGPGASMLHAVGAWTRLSVDSVAEIHEGCYLEEITVVSPAGSFIPGVLSA